MHKYKVLSTQRNTPGTILLTLGDAEPKKAFTFQSGQYAAISFRNNKRPTPARCFSITSSPTEQGILQFSMQTRGHFTSALTNLKAGDNVNVRGPFGGFVFDSLSDGDVVFLAGGIGVTPFMSMIRFAASIHLSNKVTLIYSCRDQDNIAFFEELKQLEQQNPNFKVVFMISKGPTDKMTGLNGATGRISPDAIRTFCDSNWKGTTFFICGPPPFMNGMLNELRKEGVPKKHIKTEAFGQGLNKQTGKVISWPLSMYLLTGSGLVLASFIVMVSDLFKTLPPSSVVGAKSTAPSVLTNKRELDLDKLVNSFPETDYSARPSSGVNALSRVATTQTQPAGTTTPSSVTPSGGSAPVRSSGAPVTSSAPGSSTPSGGTASATTSTPSPTPAPTPTPTPSPPPPTCKTSPSGVTTC